MIYSDESSVCKSAIHGGKLDNETGGEFIITIANGETTYDSAA
jgi:hypothetical protein